MTDQQRAAMQMALETLCNAVKPKQGNYYSMTEVPIDCAYKYQQAITALREALVSADHEKQRKAAGKYEGGYTVEALAQPQDMKECRHCGWLCKPNDAPSKKGYVLAQPQGEPVAWMNTINGFICKEKTRDYHAALYTATPSVEALALKIAVDYAIETTKEKAAKVCEEINKEYDSSVVESCVAAIRSMK